MHTIRNVNQEDHALLRRLAQACRPLDVHTPYTYWVNATYNSKCSFILEVDGVASGFVMAIEMPEVIFLWQIGIVSSLRRKGYSYYLIDDCVKYAESVGKDIELTIDAENANSNVAFIAYCFKKNLDMVALGEQVIRDDYGNVCEKEVLHHIYVSGQRTESDS